MVTVTKYHELSGFKQAGIPFQFWRSGTQSGSRWAQSKVFTRQGCFLLEALEESVSLPFPAFKPPAFLDSWPLPASSEPAAFSDLSDFASIITSSLTLALLPPSYRDTCGYTEPTWTIQGKLHILKPLITPAQSLLAGKLIESQVWGMRTRTSSGALVLLGSQGLRPTRSRLLPVSPRLLAHVLLLGHYTSGSVLPPTPVFLQVLSPPNSAPPAQHLLH